MSWALMWLILYGCEAVRHSLKNRQKMHFFVFRLFLSLCKTASQPCRLSHTNAFCINQSYQPKDQSTKFSWKILRIGGAGKWGLFEPAILNFFFFRKKKICFIPKKMSSPFIWGIIFFCTIDGFFRILEKTSSELICYPLKTVPVN